MSTWTFQTPRGTTTSLDDDVVISWEDIPLTDISQVAPMWQTACHLGLSSYSACGSGGRCCGIPSSVASTLLIIGVNKEVAAFSGHAEAVLALCTILPGRWRRISAASLRGTGSSALSGMSYQRLACHERADSREGIISRSLGFVGSLLLNHEVVVCHHVLGRVKLARHESWHIC